MEVCVFRGKTRQGKKEEWRLRQGGRQKLQRGEHSPLKGKQSKTFQEMKTLRKRAGRKDLQQR